MAEKANLNSVALWALLVLAGVLVFAAWFLWMRRGPRETPTSPAPASQLRMEEFPIQRIGNC